QWEIGVSIRFATASAKEAVGVVNPGIWARFGAIVTNRMFRSSEFTPLPVLWILSAGSGCAALIYEIVWFQLLQLVIGSSTLSLAALLGAFMGGMCVGSLALPRVISVRRHPLRIYAYLELVIGVMGILAPVVVPGLGAAPAMAYLIPPALMMGATLPAICRATKVLPRGLSSLGLLYAGNI